MMHSFMFLDESNSTGCSRSLLVPVTRPFILGTKQYAAPLEATEELIYPPSQGFREALIYRYVFGTVSYAAILTPY